MRILVTGGTGLLGSELKKILDAKYLGQEDFDIRDEDETYRFISQYDPDLVLHLAADTRITDLNKQRSYDINVMGTRNVAKACPRMVYLSTEYVFDGTKGDYTEEDYPNPLQFYGLTKLLGEYECQWCPEYVILRTVFKPRPYKHDKVPFGMKTSGDYVDVIAPMIKKVILEFTRCPKILNIGTGIKNLKDLALQTREVGDIDINSLPVKLPLDASLNLTKWKKLN